MVHWCLWCFLNSCPSYLAISSSILSTYIIFMRVAVVEHSYVRHIQRVGCNSVCIHNKSVTFKYFSFPGATFSTFVQNCELLNPLRRYEPNIIILVLGGNDFCNTVSNQTIYKNYEFVASYLKTILLNVVLIPCQIEKRFLPIQNRWNTSDTALFEKRRSAYNRKLNKCSLKHCLLRVQGPGRLDDHSNYGVDGIHLSKQGIATYWSYILQTIDYHLQSLFQS